MIKSWVRALVLVVAILSFGLVLARSSALRQVSVSEESIPVLKGIAPATQELVSQLSWEAVGYDHIAQILVPKATGPIADQLIAIGKLATAPLLAALEDPNRGVAAHLVLCSIYHPGETNGGEAPIRDSHGHTTGTIYTSFGLRWRDHIAYEKEPTSRDLNLEDLAELYMNATYTYSVTESALAENFDRWCREVPDEYLYTCRGRR